MPLLEHQPGSQAGEGSSMDRKDLILIGQITGVVGLKGELKIYSYAQQPDRFGMLKLLYVAKKAAASLGANTRGAGKFPPEAVAPAMEDVEAHEVRSARLKGAVPIVRLAGIEDRDAAESLRLHYVYMDAAELPPLPEGEYYVRELIGAAVVTEDGAKIGTLTDIRTDTPQRLYEVETLEGKTCLIPGVPACILKKSRQTIVVRLPEGLLEL